jgi:two-component system chemotaxis response regulator CheB
MTWKNKRSPVIAMAASTGGTEALEKVLRGLPPAIAPTLIVQHMPTGFTKLFADRLDTICPMEVREAKDGDVLKPGLALVAPADLHMELVKYGANLCVRCFAGKKLHGVMPSADILFDSVERVMKDRAIGVILTGMGADGASGLLKMRRAGAATIGQDKLSSIVYGMPKAAAEMGAVEHELPLDRIADKINGLLLANEMPSISLI